MHALVIYAHPNPGSFNHAILEAFTEGLSDGGKPFEVVDLYGINFDPCLSMKDLENVHRGTYSEDIIVQQQKVSQADGLAFIHPVWFTMPPAILLGWFNRVFSFGFAYRVEQIEGRVKHTGLLKNQKALFINTAGDSESKANTYAMGDTLIKLEDERLLRRYGVKEVHHAFFYNVVLADNDTRRRYLEEARNLGKNF